MQLKNKAHCGLLLHESRLMSWYPRASEQPCFNWMWDTHFQVMVWSHLTETTILMTGCLLVLGVYYLPRINSETKHIHKSQQNSFKVQVLPIQNGNMQTHENHKGIKRFFRISDNETTKTSPSNKFWQTSSKMPAFSWHPCHIIHPLPECQGCRGWREVR